MNRKLPVWEMHIWVVCLLLIADRFQNLTKTVRAQASFSSQKNLERCYCKHDSGLSVHPCLSCCFLCVYVMLILYAGRHTHTHTHTHTTKALWWDKFCSGRAFFVPVPTHMCGARIRTMQRHNGATERCGNRVDPRSPLLHVIMQKITGTGLCCDLRALLDTTCFFICCLRTKTFLRNNKLLMG